jgi:hypothetical protein
VCKDTPVSAKLKHWLFEVGLSEFIIIAFHIFKTLIGLFSFALLNRHSCAKLTKPASTGFS